MGLDGCGANAAPYVLGALTEQESAAFVTHMESCAVCREEVAALEVVASVLPASAPRVSAPGELKRRVMASVREDERRRRSAEQVVAGRRRAGARPVWRGALAAGALAAVVIALAVVALSTSGTSGRARVIQAQVIPAHASALLKVSGGQAELKIADMPQSAPGRVYEVWVKRAGGPLPTDALFTVAADGAATVGVPGGVNGVREVMVTSEPRGGSSAPTTQPLIIARVS
jgi:anti-sigma-K factor RskA